MATVDIMRGQSLSFPITYFLTPEKNDAYYYSLLLLFVPFRDESQLINEAESPKEAFDRLITNNSQMNVHHDRLKEMLRAQVKVAKINEARQAQPEVNVKNLQDKDDASPEVQGEAKAAMDDINNLQLKKVVIDSNILRDRISMLNSDQRRIFDTITNHLSHQFQHENKTCTCVKEIKPLHMFFSGVGGNLIETIQMKKYGKTRNR